MKKLLIAGANGFIGRHLTQYFADLGWEVAGLARRKEGLHAQCRYVNWDGENPGSWTAELESCDVLINMVGRSVNCRHTDENKRQILESRVESTKLLGQAIAECENPPSLWINGSGVSVYKESFTTAHGETGEHGEGFMAEVVKKWEGAFFSTNIADSIRRVALRTSMVLADEPGNPYRVLHTLAKFGLGGKVATGKQMVSWVHIADVPRVVEFIIDNEELTGPVNMAVPDAVSNAEMMKRFRKHAGMPLGIPAPAFGVKIGAALMGTAPELILDSCFVAPEKLLDGGFEFKYSDMKPDEW